jgi:hypothetical protein
MRIVAKGNAFIIINLFPIIIHIFLYYIFQVGLFANLLLINCQQIIK